MYMTVDIIASEKDDISVVVKHSYLLNTLFCTIAPFI